MFIGQGAGDTGEKADAIGEETDKKEGMKLNWVAPIKDEKTIMRFKELLRDMDDKYYIMFEIGVGTGLQLQDILQFKIRDIANKDSITVEIGTKNIKQTFHISKELQKIINDFIAGKDMDAYLITGHKSSSRPLSREQAYRALKAIGKSIGISSIGAQTMRKTFAWKYYKETGDIYYLQNLFNHASPSITYRYIGEKPNIEIILKKLTPEENERSRYMLYLDNSGRKRLDGIIQTLSAIRNRFDEPTNNDAFYGSVECLLDEIERIMESYHDTK